MSQSTIAQPSVQSHAPRRVSALVVAMVALVATLAIAVAVFAWTTAGGSDPTPPTLPSVEPNETPSVEGDILPANGVPVLYESCIPRSACAF